MRLTYSSKLSLRASASSTVRGVVLDVFRHGHHLGTWHRLSAARGQLRASDSLIHVQYGLPLVDQGSCEGPSADQIGRREHRGHHQIVGRLGLIHEQVRLARLREVIRWPCSGQGTVDGRPTDAEGGGDPGDRGASGGQGAGGGEAVRVISVARPAGSPAPHRGEISAADEYRWLATAHGSVVVRRYGLGDAHRRADGSSPAPCTVWRCWWPAC